MTAMPPTSAGSRAPARSALAPNVSDAALSAAYAGLALLAATETPGMVPVGAPVSGTLREGAKLTRPVQLEPGKCYAALGFGVGVTELDVWLSPSSSGQVEAPIVRDTHAGPQAVLGGKGHCFKWAAALPVPAQFVIKATAGSGVIAAQLYVK